MLRIIIFIVLAGLIIFLAFKFTPGIFQAEQEIHAEAEEITNTNENTETESEPVSAKETIMEGLVIQDLKEGTGPTAEAGQSVTVHYVGTLENGTKFDSSRDRGTPFTFNLGAGEVIQGWDSGVVGMKVGGLRKLSIAPELGYGGVANGPIPANSTLLFEVELLAIQ